MRKSSKLGCRALVLGGSGMAGGAIVQQLAAEGFDVSWTFRTPRLYPAIPPGTTYWFAPESYEAMRVELKSILKAAKPKVIVNALRGDGEYLYLINSCVPHMLEMLTDVPVVHISTNAVFPRSSCYWEDKHRPNPTTDYGMSKLFGERPSQFVIRTSIVGIPAYQVPADRVRKYAVSSRKCLWNGVTNITLARVIAIAVLYTAARGSHSCGIVRHIVSKPVLWPTVVQHLATTFDLKVSQYSKISQPLLLDGYVVKPTLKEQIAELRSPSFISVTKLPSLFCNATLFPKAKEAKDCR